MVYYSPEEIAQKYNVQSNTVRLWIRSGRLNAIKLGGIWRVNDKELEDFIKQNRKKPDEPNGREDE